jgi:very-short-patch-repair endonuclease
VRARDRIAELLAEETVILRREHPELQDSLSWQVRRGELTAVLPGIYTTPQAALDPLVLVAALARGWPETVFTRATAARLSYWPELPVRVVTATARTNRAARSGLRWERRQIPPELVMTRGGLSMTTPALTALDLSDLDHTEPLDMALRQRVVTVQTLREALDLTANRRGNADRWAVVLDSRSGPWSYPERLGHRLLRRTGIKGWRANYPFREPGGNLYYIDIAFEQARLAIEIDGRIHATNLEVFESDRWRQNALVNANWRVLRFTYCMIQQHPEVFVRTIQDALAQSNSNFATLDRR